MTDEIEALFSDPEQVNKVIIEARRLFGSTQSTPEQLDAAEKALGLAFFYAPEDMAPMVEATLHEMTMRRLMVRVGVQAELVDESTLEAEIETHARNAGLAP